MDEDDIRLTNKVAYYSNKGVQFVQDNVHVEMNEIPTNEVFRDEVSQE